LVAQESPAMQALQVPLTQSMALPQGVPSLAFAPSSQVIPSAPQTMRPTLQGPPGFVSHTWAIPVPHPDASCGPASKCPELTAASTMPPT